MANHRSSEIKVEDKLRGMKGRTFLYNTMTVQILSWKYDGEYCTVVTSGPWLTKTTAEMSKFIDENFMEVEGDEEPGNNLPAPQAYEAVPQLGFKSLSKADELVDLLFDNIEKVTANKDHVDQGNAVANLAGRIMHIAKTQIEAKRLENELHRNR